ncbi:MAG: hypothetical protein SFY92_03980 [Verrucomicrobiae bacterium]|nr:hypothetical protein [Verrucomicrobiae bacterium]
MEPNGTSVGRCFTEIGGELYAVRNWQHRGDSHDAAMMTRLNGPQAAQYRKMKAEGFSDSKIFRDIFPAPPKPSSTVIQKGQTVEVDLDFLTAGQLACLINHLLGTDIASLARLPVRDLRKMYLAVKRTRRFVV